MTLEGSDRTFRRLSLKDQPQFFDAKEVKKVYVHFLPQVFASVSEFLKKEIGALVPRTYLADLSKSYKENDCVRFVTGDDLAKVARPLMKAKGLALPQGRIPIGFTHPQTRQIYVVTDRIPTQLMQGAYGVATKPDRVAGVESVGRRVLVEEMVHRNQDMENINGALGEYAAAYYVRGYYRRHNLKQFIWSPTDELMADIYENICKRVGSRSVESVCFGTYSGPALNKAMINLVFQTEAEKLMKKHADHRLVMK